FQPQSTEGAVGSPRSLRNERPPRLRSPPSVTSAQISPRLSAIAQGIRGPDRWSGMATIRASCPDCGDVELTTADMTVRVCSEDQRGTYAFRCPACTMAVTKSAEPRIVDLLVSSGVELQVWTLPAELREPRPIGEPFSHD